MFSRTAHKTNISSSDYLKSLVLDQSSVNIMVADAQRRIVYMNDAVTHFLRSVEQDIQKDLPHFRVDTLIGQSIDVFHARPERQRQLLETLHEPYKASIRVGGKQFDLLAVPLFNSHNQRIGTSVEWLDATTRLQNEYYAALTEAMNRSQAVIEFNMDGTIITANENFLSTMGYTLSEIQGRHHSLFAEESYRNSTQYRAFWEKLNRGEFDSGQYKRLGKGGREVWIEASYNPILDRNGKPYKVVKYATNITERVQIGRTIDRNMTEIDGVVVSLNQQSDSVMAAISETTNNVQTVAAGAEEMAASVTEISASMARSRSAAEEVAAKAQQADDATQRLTRAATEMGGIVETIDDIASQINLLALNATIESARAGDAGKGFAVVAGEVKNLAGQAGEATKHISGEIANIQNITRDVVEALASIKQSMDDLREYVTTTAGAVEEQSAVTSDIAGHMQTASKSVSSIAASINEVVVGLQQASQAIRSTREVSRALTVN